MGILGGFGDWAILWFVTSMVAHKDTCFAIFIKRYIYVLNTSLYMLYAIIKTAKIKHSKLLCITTMFHIHQHNSKGHLILVGKESKAYRIDSKVWALINPK